MANDKVTQKEIDNAMKTFMANAAMPAGMVNPIMGMMALNQGLPAQVPQGALMQMGYPNLAAGQMTAQQAIAMQGGMVSPQNATGYKTVGMATKVRYGKPQIREWGQCKDCAKATEKDGVMWCNHKQMRVRADGGKVYMEVEQNGKKEKLVDDVNSCRQFVKF